MYEPDSPATTAPRQRARVAGSPTTDIARPRPTRTGHSADPFVQWLAARHFDESLEVFGALHRAAHSSRHPASASKLRTLARDLLDDASVLAFLARSHRPGAAHPAMAPAPIRRPDSARPVAEAAALGEARVRMRDYIDGLKATATVLSRRNNAASAMFSHLGATAEARMGTVADQPAA